MSGVLRIATRKSALALWQARHVSSLLEAQYEGLRVELVPIVTEGDRMLDKPLARIGGKGLFLKELERAMLEGHADLAVHSMKDIPAEINPGLVLQSALPRATPFDALVSRGRLTLSELPPGSRVGTSSLRRQSQLLALRPDIHVTDLRGNLDTRLGKLDAGEYDAIILACAGLERLGLADRICEVLEPPDWLPAVTQGIIALQCRADDAGTKTLVDPLTDADSTAQSVAERTVARVLQGSCQVPLAAYAQINGGSMELAALVGTPDGRRLVRAAESGYAADAAAIGQSVAEKLLARGARQIIEQLNSPSPG